MCSKEVNKKMYSCSGCGQNFTRSDNLRRHMRESCVEFSVMDEPSGKRSRLDLPSTPSLSLYTCNCCNKTLRANEIASHRRTLQHRTNACVALSDGVQIVQTAFQGRIVSYRVTSKNHHTDYIIFFNEIKHKVVKLLEEALRIHKIVKVNMELFGRYIIQIQEVWDMKSFNTSNKVIDESMDLEAVVDAFIDLMVSQTSEFQERGSGM